MLLPKFLYPGWTYLTISLLIAVIFDAIYPYHKGILYKIHPVHTAFVLSQKLYRPYSSKYYGLFIWIITMTVHLSIYTILLFLSYKINIIIWIIVSSYIIKNSFSFKLLYDIVKEVMKSLKTNNIEKSRFYVSNIVRRDVSNLDDKHIASAAIESLSESFVDSILSPLFFFAFLGPIGALLQRLINTLDGSLGFKDEEHKNVGFTSAIADTIINYIPARLSVIIFAISSMITNNGVISLFKCWREYRNKTESINAGNPMSSIAGSLKISLEKIGSYKLCNYELPDFKKIDNALKITLVSYILTIIFIILIVFII